MVDWCRSKVSHLIEQLRKHHILWDVRCTEEKDKHLKAEALREISRALGIPVQEVMKKLHSLKVQFSREYCRVRKEKQRTGRLYVPKWYGYEQLLFLKDANTRHRKFVRQPNDELNDCANSDEISVASLNSIIKEEYAEPDTQDEVGSSVFIPPKETPRAPSPPIHHSSLPAPFNELKTQLFEQKLTENQSGNYDEFISFGLYIANKLRALDDPYLQAIAKNDMNKAIFNVELRKCQRLVTDNTSKEAD